MKGAGETLCFIHLTDTHFGPDRTYARHGYRAWSCARELVTRINDLPFKPDFIIHTGDVVTDPDPVSYRLAAETLGLLDFPTYYVTGNHDRTEDILRYLPMGAYEDLGSRYGLLSYRFDCKGRRFLVVDARAPDALDPHGLLGDEQLAIVREEVERGRLPLVVFIHFPLLPVNAPWFDENMLVINGIRLHEILLSAGDRLLGVFHGHLHMARETVRDGIIYSSASSTFANFSALPGVPGMQVAPTDPRVIVTSD